MKLSYCKLQLIQWYTCILHSRVNNPHTLKVHLSNYWKKVLMNGKKYYNEIESDLLLLLACCRFHSKIQNCHILQKLHLGRHWLKPFLEIICFHRYSWHFTHYHFHLYVFYSLFTTKHFSIIYIYWGFWFPLNLFLSCWKYS